ncbi:MAG: phenylalanine--tRNA ligase subunit beta [Nitrospinae bacterium]|nr:phenylalanine--tRNA ligase subunit beta [Nitrospinota bacterium]
MRIPYSWIKEFAPITASAEDVAAKLSVSGIETVARPFGERVENLVTAKIKSVAKHPQKDALLICQVDTGQGGAQIITAATNVFEGAVVGLAKPGAVIGGRTISPVKFGDYDSSGMFVSLKELGLEDTSGGVFIFDNDTPAGVDVSALLGLGEERIIEIDVTANRGDALSVRGLAREICAIYGVKCPSTAPALNISTGGPINIKLESAGVYRYRGVTLENVKVAPSPLSMRLRLIKSGIGPINNAVDITNYILLQEGQPLHAFDMDKLKGSVYGRLAREWETILCLDGAERKLLPGDLVIADDEGPIALAGVIGGERAKVAESTTNILLESAVFDGRLIRKTAKRLAVFTDSSYRFERGVDIVNLPVAEDRAVELFVSHAGARAVAVSDQCPNPYTPAKVTITEKETKRILGVEVPASEIARIMEQLELPATISGPSVTVEIPPFRAMDLEREIDLIEEVARLRGLDTLEPTFPSISMARYKKSDEFLFETRARDYFKGCGLDETVTYTFLGDEDFMALGLAAPTQRIQNSIIQTQSVMRHTLSASLLKTLQENLRYQTRDLSVYEISSCFFENHEDIRAGILVTGAKSQGYGYTRGKAGFNTVLPWSFVALKGLIQGYFDFLGVGPVVYERSETPYLHPFESAVMKINGADVGYLGRIHPETADKLGIPGATWLAEIKLRCVPRDIEEPADKEGYLFTAYANKNLVNFAELPKFPSVRRDIALTVGDDLAVERLALEIRETSKLIEDVSLFDVYFMGEGKKSAAFAIGFRSREKSLEDEEVNGVMSVMLERLARRFPGLKIRE